LAGNSDTSETREFTVDVSPPVIILGDPENNTYTNDDPIMFFFNLSDGVGIENCSLILNDTINYTKDGASLDNNAENNITTSLGD